MDGRDSIINRFSRNTKAITFGLIIWILISFPIVLAEHEPNHRYTIMGEILDSNGNPLSNVEVTAITMGGGLSGVGVTDRNGKYSIQLHIHNENLGDDLLVTARGVVYETKVAFNPNDITKERIMVLNLRGKTWTLGESRSDRINFTSMVIITILIALLYFAVKSSRKRSKETTTRQTKKGKRRRR